MPRFYALLKKERLGPFNLDELRELSMNKALSTTTPVVEEQTGATSTVGELLSSGRTDYVPVVPVTHPVPSPPRHPPATAVRNGSVSAVAEQPWRPRVSRWLRAAVYGLLSLYLLFRRPSWFPLDWINLVMHEAGHTAFGYCGEFLHFLGGTIFQLAVPALIAGYFIREGKAAGVQFGLFWLGESLLNVSMYVADARALALPLLGGEHDWNYLLGRMGLLNQDKLIAAFFVVAAAVVFAVAALWAFPLRRSRGARGPAAVPPGSVRCG